MSVLSLWRGVIPGNPGHPISGPVVNMSVVSEHVARRHGLSLASIRAGGKSVRMWSARREAQWIIRNLRKADGGRRYSLQQIGDFFGVDHSTIVKNVHRHHCKLEGIPCRRAVA